MPGFNLFYNTTSIRKDTNKHLINNTIKGENYTISRFTLDKFMDDKIFIEDENCIIVIEGIILNKKDLLLDSNTSWDKAVWNLYVKNGDTFFNIFRGSFAGILFDKGRKKWIIFTDQIGSKSLYYYTKNNQIILSAEIKDLYIYLKTNRQNYKLDREAAYMLLSYAYLLGDKTLCADIKKLLPGHYLVIQNEEITLREYYKLPVSTMKGAYNEHDLIEVLDKKFKKAVQLQFDKDKEYGYKHIVSLSGGLDSRMTTWVAHELGYTEQLNFTFSQSDYLDEVIAKKISADLGHEWIFKALDNGIFLKDMEQVTDISGGHILYYALAHSNSIFKYINFSDLGIIHSGILGDVIIGSYIKNTRKENLPSFPGWSSNKFIHKISVLPGPFPDFCHQELAMIYQRGFNMINSGAHLFQQYAETISPFCYIDFLEFCLAIPIELRSHHKTYFKWIIQKYPGAARYIWESTRSRIDSKWMIKIKGNKIPVSQIPYLSLFKAGILKRGLNSKNHMNPLDYWYNNNPDIRSFQDNYFKNNINRISDTELRSDCTWLYTEGTAGEKNQVLTLLSALKLFY